MVQRKVANKLCIQADPVKSEKGLINCKPSYSQHQDGKNRGADLKKKMKKSRSMIKHSNFESLQSPPPPPLSQEVPQPGKPPPLDVSTSTATPRKQSPVKAPEASPNYMKSTSSFDARKERSEVSSRNSLTSISTTIPSPKKHSSASDHKAARTLTRTSSLRHARTLTKSPSFKPARAMTKKCSPAILCQDLDVQRATCSSTLKDSKFPNYLTLNTGATESEGTSVTKVCAYNYCSLNGHRHATSPPLKCFLSTRRRMLKTHKSIKIGCLSPRRAKPSVEIDAGQVSYAEEPATQGLDLNSSPITPLMQEEKTDFFIEIYINDTEDTANTIGRSKHDGDDKDMVDFSVHHIMPLVEASNETEAETAPLVQASDETEAENANDQIMESLLDESPCSKIYFEDNLDQSEISTKMDISEFFPEEDQNAEVVEEIHPPSLDQEEATPECLSNQRDLELESPPSIQVDEQDSEASDMEWAAGQYSVPCPDDVPIFKSDDIDSSFFKEILDNEVLQGFFDEESVNSEAWVDDGDSDLDDSYLNLERYESDETMSTEITRNPIEDLIEEPKATSEDKIVVPEVDNEIPRMDIQLGDDQIKRTTDIKDEILIDHQGNERTQNDFANALAGNQEFNSPHDFTEQDQDEASIDNCTASHDNIEVYKSDKVTESIFSNEAIDGSLLPTEDSETDQNFIVHELPNAGARDGIKEKQQVDAAKSLVGIQTSHLLKGFSQADEDMTSGDNDESELVSMAKDGESNQTFGDECLPAETQDRSPGKQSQSENVENHHTEKDQDEAENLKISNSMDFEDKTHSETKRLRLTENRDQDDGKMEVENASKSDAEETWSMPKRTSSSETKNLLFQARSNSNQEVTMICKNQRGKVRCKRPVEEWEETRTFNPQEPNYLPVEPHPEAEKVDLRHQMTDERKNAEEWMLDYALRQTVTKLAPARNRKVALLVEAFETVSPIPKYETHMRHTSAAFAHARTIEACR